MMSFMHDIIGNAKQDNKEINLQQKGQGKICHISQRKFYGAVRSWLLNEENEERIKFGVFKELKFYNEDVGYCGENHSKKDREEADMTKETERKS